MSMFGQHVYVLTAIFSFPPSSQIDQCFIVDLCPNFFGKSLGFQIDYCPFHSSFCPSSSVSGAAFRGSLIRRHQELLPSYQPRKLATPPPSDRYVLSASDRHHLSPDHHQLSACPAVRASVHRPAPVGRRVRRMPRAASRLLSRPVGVRSRASECPAAGCAGRQESAVVPDSGPIATDRRQRCRSAALCGHAVW